MQRITSGILICALGSILGLLSAFLFRTSSGFEPLPSILQQRDDALEIKVLEPKLLEENATDLVREKETQRETERERKSSRIERSGANTSSSTGGGTKCDFGMKGGTWRNRTTPGLFDSYEWYPHSRADPNSSCEFEQFLQSEFPSTFQGKSMFFIGDSLDRNALQEFCKKYGQEPQAWRKQNEYVRMLYCVVNGFTIGFYHNIGILNTAPNFYMLAYAKPFEGYKSGMAANVGVDLQTRITKDAASFKTKVLGGRDPTLIVTQSHLWDFVKVNGEPASTGWQVKNGMHKQWYSKAKELVKLVHASFPQSHVVWRHAAPVPTARADARLYPILDAMVQDGAPSMNLDIIDFRSVLTADGCPEWPDGKLKQHIHPSGNGSLALVNIELNILADLIYNG